VRRRLQTSADRLLTPLAGVNATPTREGGAKRIAPMAHLGGEPRMIRHNTGTYRTVDCGSVKDCRSDEVRRFYNLW